MNILKRVVLIFALIVVAGADILIYRDSNIYYRAQKIEDNEEKIEVLERATQFYRSNDLVFNDLGKAYFDLGLRSLNDSEKSNAYFQKSIQNFKHAIRINPASQFNHFNLAQSLLYMSFFSPSLDPDSYDEFKKAATLVGENSQIFFEVGKIFLSRWSELSEEDRAFTLEILKKIGEGRDREKLRALMHVWEMNVKNYEVMEKILPDDPQIYMLYAQFLGEKSLSLEERQKVMANADFLEFERAKSEHDSGKNEFLYYRLKEAFPHFKSCLNILERIKFYQNLTLESLVDFIEFNELRKSAFLNLAKCCLEEGIELKEVEGYLSEYLALEDKVGAVGELESYLKERGLIGGKLEADFDDLERLPFLLYLYFKQSRYRDIVRIGRLLQQSFFVVPEEKREAYVRILQLLGDSYQRVDYIYDAGEFYVKALEFDPENLETLVRLRQNYEKRNEDEKIREINGRIDKFMSPKERIFKNLTINKSRSFSHILTLDGREIILDLFFKDNKDWITPLITVFFNDQAIWEGYLKDEVLSLPLKSRVGKNTLEIAAVNRAASLNKLSYR